VLEVVPFAGGRGGHVACAVGAVMCCVPLCMLMYAGGCGGWALFAGGAGGTGGDALCAALNRGCQECAQFWSFEISIAAVFSLQFATSDIFQLKPKPVKDNHHWIPSHVTTSFELLRTGGANEGNGVCDYCQPILYYNIQNKLNGINCCT
jgi:hypothetical protein